MVDPRCAEVAQPDVGAVTPASYRDIEMSLLIEAVSVIVRLEALQTRFYFNGLDGYLSDVRNGSGCHDEYLVRVGFRDPWEAGRWADNLRLQRFQPLDDKGNAGDYVVIDQVMGAWSPCPWIEIATPQDLGADFGRLTGVDRWEPFATPEGWTPDAHARLRPIGIAPTPSYWRELGYVYRAVEQDRDAPVEEWDWDNARWIPTKLRRWAMTSELDVFPVSESAVVAAGISVELPPGPPIGYLYVESED